MSTRFGKNRSGATAIEYALMMCMAALVIITAVTQLGQKTASNFNNVVAGFH